jgi:hypothetical protein
MSTLAGARYELPLGDARREAPPVDEAYQPRPAAPGGAPLPALREAHGRTAASGGGVTLDRPTLAPCLLL